MALINEGLISSARSFTRASCWCVRSVLYRVLIFRHASRKDQSKSTNACLSERKESQETRQGAPRAES